MLPAKFIRLDKNRDKSSNPCWCKRVADGQQLNGMSEHTSQQFRDSSVAESKVSGQQD